MFDEAKEAVMRQYEETLARKNSKAPFYNGVFDRYINPVLTREHIPPFWKYDFSREQNPTR